MAEFIFMDKDKYKVNGVLTEDDIYTINNFLNRTILVLDNTKGVNSEALSKIKNDRVVFCVKGGLDFENKDKYKQEKYMDRTYISPLGLMNIVKYFEYNEKLIDPNWNEFEKAMFLYNALVVDMEYAENYDMVLSDGITERSLNGILYSKLVCAGFALVYKEMLDRVDIKNYYQNQKDVHAFNVIEIDGKYYGVDVTWDNTKKKNNNGKCSFSTFAHDPNFYTQHGHVLYKEEVKDVWNSRFIDMDIVKVFDKDEEQFELSILSMEQLNEYYNHIKDSINNRKSVHYNLQDQSIETKNRYLPVNIRQINIQKEAEQEYSIISIIKFLEKRNALNIDPKVYESLTSRNGYISDVYLDRHSINLSDFGIDNCEIDYTGDIRLNNKYSSLSKVGLNNNNLTNEELKPVYDKLNVYLNNYLKQYITDVYANTNNLLDKLEYKPNEWDEDRAIEYTNITTKLFLVTQNKEYLKELGFNEEEIDSKIASINGKIEDIHKPYEYNISKRDSDLDFLSAIFCTDLNQIHETMNIEEQKELSEKEFIELYKNPDYLIKLFEKYYLIAGKDKFELSNFDVTKEDIKKMVDETITNLYGDTMEATTSVKTL